MDPVADLPDLELDGLRVRQALSNLVANALRHTPAGGRVRVGARLEPDGAQVAWVADTGSGMDPETAARAFDRFWRSPDSPGAGLGLAIARDLVAAHGGTVELTSAPGEGTTVRCRFPRQDEADAAVR
jgi:two-component system sensor histidine kinase BaeS